MSGLAALFPPAVVLVLVLGFKASGLVASAAALTAAVLVWVAGSGEAGLAAGLIRAGADAAILTALVAAMIVPGILFVEATRGRKSPEAIGDLVRSLHVTGGRAAILIATGIGVVVESLTGMGVSLMVTMPLLLSLFDKRAAIGIGLVGMSLMPWGALSISAHVGAKLSAVPIETLKYWIAGTSGSVAFLLPLLALWFLPSAGARDIGFAMAAGLALVAGVWLGTATIGVEVAGVAGGLAVILVVTALAPSRSGFSEALKAAGLRPYLALLLAVVGQKLLIAPLAGIGVAPALDTGRVQFALMTSPGVALLIATLATAGRSVTPGVLATVLQRAWRPIVAIALFMLAARLLAESGAIAALAASVGGLGRDASLVVVALLGAVGGFVTGSGVTGNALFMPSAAAAGQTFDVVPIFAALQNAASGHAGMASLPVAAILLATLGRREPGDDGLVMRIGLGLVAVHVTVATIAALVLVRVAA